MNCGAAFMPYDPGGYQECVQYGCDLTYRHDTRACDNDYDGCFFGCAIEDSNCWHGQGYSQQGCEDNYETGVGNCAEQNGQCTDLCYQLYP